MPTLPRAEREALAAKRLRSVLKRHGIATLRTLEQKISDAGPTPQRIDPHILTVVRKKLVEAGDISLVAAKKETAKRDWYHLPDTPKDVIAERLNAQVAILQALDAGDLPHRIGQSLEIAVFKSLANAPFNFIGHFDGLTDHDDSKLYAKHDPTNFAGRKIPGKMALDFITSHDGKRAAGIEVKNIREWIYPNRDEVRELLFKCCALNVAPVLIARRIQFSTFSVLHKCGVLLHQNYNQLLPASAADLAAQAKDKTLLGYHDIRVQNEPDKRLNHFLHTVLPNKIEEAHDDFQRYRDLLEAYANGMDYEEFAARVRRRNAGTNEDSDEDPHSDPEGDEYY